jgi:hypothetical protein
MRPARSIYEPLLLAGREGLLQFGPVISLPALDLGELRYKGPAPPVQVVQHRFPLCLEAKPRFALPICADPEVCDEFPVMCRHTLPQCAHVSAKWAG